MTREEAVEFGNMWLQINEDCKDSSTYTFFQMAIRSFEAWDKVVDKIERIGGSEEKSVYKCQHQSYVRGLEKSLEIINEHLKRVTEDE